MRSRNFRRRAATAGVAILCLAIGVALGPALAGAAETFKDVIVKNTPAEPVPTQAIGTTAVAGTVQVSAPALRRDHGILTDNEDLITIPEGVVLTDILLDRLVGSTDNECDVWIAGIQGTLPSTMFVLRPRSADRFVQVHFEHGLRSVAGDRLGLAMTSLCNVRFLWTGFEG
jgi:hypothetical protein